MKIAKRGSPGTPEAKTWVSLNPGWSVLDESTVDGIAVMVTYKGACEGSATMMLSMFDQMLFHLACGHTVVLGRLEKAATWTCEKCGTTTDLRAEPHKQMLADNRRMASEFDKENLARGWTIVTRAGRITVATGTSLV
jgi:hypothetical protein